MPSPQSVPPIARLCPTREAQEALRHHFLDWQCRLRRYAVRQAAGRPLGGMCPMARPRGKALRPIVVLLQRQDLQEQAAYFRHLCQRTQDPVERRDFALCYLGASYYQDPLEFEDRMTALFSGGSQVAERLRAAGRCELEFDFQDQYYNIPCRTARLAHQDPAFQATYWHNLLFHPQLPGNIQVLAFLPEWAGSRAEPMPSRAMPNSTT